MNSPAIKGQFASKLPAVRCFDQQVTEYGQRLTTFQADVDAAIARVDAALADYRSL